MTLFNELTTESLVKEISLLSDDPKFCLSKEKGTPFIRIFPKTDKNMPLKQDYEKLVARTEKELKDDFELKNRVKKKLKKINCVQGEEYKNEQASFKLHLNLNGIRNINKEVVLGLIKLLKDEAESDKNSLSYFFKIIDLEALNQDGRFEDTDQITIYFDKYSSLGDMLQLSETIEQYLLDNDLKENKIPLGPKESFGFNSFVSGRFDTNPLLEIYREHRFFDLELKKFFENHQKNELQDIPFCLLESIFNHILISEEIEFGSSYDPISDEISIKIQTEFTKALHDSKIYISEQAQKYKEEQLLLKKTKQDNMKNLIKKIENFKPDFSQCKSLNDIKKHKIKLQKELTADKEQYVKLYTQINEEMIPGQPGYKALEKAVKKDLVDKENEINSSAEIIQLEQVFNKSLNTLNEFTDTKKKEIKLYDHFESLLDLFQKKAQAILAEENKIIKKEPAHSNDEPKSKGIVAMELYNELKNEFTNFKLNPQKDSYTRFKTTCINSIKDKHSVLEQHRDKGWKELILNVLAGIASFGFMPLYMYTKTQGKKFFFEVSTDSRKKVNAIENFINNNEVIDGSNMLTPKPK